MPERKTKLWKPLAPTVTQAICSPPLKYKIYCERWSKQAPGETNLASTKPKTDKSVFLTTRPTDETIDFDKKLKRMQSDAALVQL